ncbi:hypothetical protein HK099_000308 [Clydaea vesicula]|uniref:Uncharacterized protein n=1 Tax=Clydaea vesicula TaxID=447962 RepID=A0AAD5TVJ7_9FUNG|nr:hypothetical protein HK099_000308 [Clydaea vesicula]KAJ3376864.1 hypothetical protein HDU92_008930 [Lobulomyces angularis]
MPSQNPAPSAASSSDSTASNDNDFPPFSYRVHQTKILTPSILQIQEGPKYRKDIRIKSTVINKVSYTVLFLTMWSVLIVLLYHFAKPIFKVSDLPSKPLFIPILSIVIGLLLVFRTNTAYDRYWTGRKLWTNLKFSSLNLGRLIWIQAKVESKRDKFLQTSAINLIYAFNTAVKHNLRQEYYQDYADLKPYNVETSEVIDYEEENLNLPIDISNKLSSFIIHLINEGQIDVSTESQLHNNLNLMIDCFSKLEVIRNTPLPVAYSMHLFTVLFLYLLALPFSVLVATKEIWYTIPIMFLTSFALMGISAVADEIENPFGYDDADLPLDSYCDEVKSELDILVKKKNPHTPKMWEDFIEKIKHQVIEIADSVLKK